VCATLNVAFGLAMATWYGHEAMQHATPNPVVPPRLPLAAFVVVSAYGMPHTRHLNVWAGFPPGPLLLECMAYFSCGIIYGTAFMFTTSVCTIGNKTVWRFTVVDCTVCCLHCALACNHVSSWCHRDIAVNNAQLQTAAHSFTDHENSVELHTAKHFTATHSTK
jgi:hypothetical protein